MPPELRAFFYLPFEHSENLADQEHGIALYKAAGDADGLKWAELHADIIRRFGRFPHRNAALGRTTARRRNRRFSTAAASPAELVVMSGLVPAIHAFTVGRKTWLPGTRPGMTTEGEVTGSDFHGVFPYLVSPIEPGRAHRHRRARAALSPI